MNCLYCLTVVVLVVFYVQLLVPTFLQCNVLFQLLFGVFLEWLRFGRRIFATPKREGVTLSGV
jgi:hypothetical protein